MPKLTVCPKIFDVMGEDLEERKKEGRLPPWRFCGSFMSRIYRRASRRRRDLPSAKKKKSQPYQPVGWYCDSCGTFRTDAQYEEQKKDYDKKYRMFNLCFFSGYRYNYHNNEKENKGT